MAKNNGENIRLYPDSYVVGFDDPKKAIIAISEKLQGEATLVDGYVRQAAEHDARSSALDEETIDFCEHALVVHLTYLNLFQHFDKANPSRARALLLLGASFTRTQAYVFKIFLALKREEVLAVQDATSTVDFEGAEGQGMGGAVRAVTQKESLKLHSRNLHNGLTNVVNFLRGKVPESAESTSATQQKGDEINLSKVTKVSSERLFSKHNYAFGGSVESRFKSMYNVCGKEALKCFKNASSFYGDLFHLKSVSPKSRDSARITAVIEENSTATMASMLFALLLPYKDNRKTDDNDIQTTQHEYIRVTSICEFPAKKRDRKAMWMHALNSVDDSSFDHELVDLLQPYVNFNLGNSEQQQKDRQLYQWIFKKTEKVDETLLGPDFIKNINEVAGSEMNNRLRAYEEYRMNLLSVK